MARHILEGHGHPVFYWGSTYGGTLESHLLVPLFAVVGATPEAFRAFYVLLWASFVAGATAFTGRFFGRLPGLAAAAYLAVPPFFLPYKVLTSDGAYASVALFGLDAPLDRVRGRCQARVGPARHGPGCGPGLRRGPRPVGHARYGSDVCGRGALALRPAGAPSGPCRSSRRTRGSDAGCGSVDRLEPPARGSQHDGARARLGGRYGSSREHPGLFHGIPARFPGGGAPAFHRAGPVSRFRGRPSSCRSSCSACSCPRSWPRVTTGGFACSSSCSRRSGAPRSSRGGSTRPSRDTSSARMLHWPRLWACLWLGR